MEDYLKNSTDEQLKELYEQLQELGNGGTDKQPIRSFVDEVGANGVLVVQLEICAEISKRWYNTIKYNDAMNGK